MKSATLLAVIRRGGVGDTTPPTISSVTAPSNGTYYVGQNLNFTVNWSETVTVTGTPRIALTVGAATKYANYVSGSPGTALTFRYTVAEGDADSDGIAMTSPMELNSGTIKDAAGNNATLTFTAPDTSAVLVFTVTSLANLYRWLKADVGTGGVSDGDPVGTWTDQSGGSHNMTQATAGLKPLYKLNILNGLPAVRGDGSDDYISGAIVAGANHTVFIVAKKNSAVGATNKGVWSIGAVGSLAQMYTNSSVSTGYNYYGAPGQVGVGGTPTSATIIAIRYNSAASVDFYFGGGTPTNKDPDDQYTTATSMGLFAEITAPGNYGDFDVVEFVHVSATMTAANMNLLGNYLVWRTGLTWSAVS